MKEIFLYATLPKYKPHVPYIIARAHHNGGMIENTCQDLRSSQSEKGL